MVEAAHDTTAQRLKTRNPRTGIPVLYSDEEVAEVKRLIAGAKRKLTYAHGELSRVSRQTGMPLRYVRSLAYGEYRNDVEPA